MNFEEILISRRSIRRYTSEKIDSASIRNLIKAAMYAPSAVNKRPWHFIIVEDKGKMEEVMKIHANAKMLKEASHAILICGDENLQHDDGFWIADCGAATQNLLLAAHGKGIGSCWIGIYPREQRMKDISNLFNLPKHVKPFALVSLGYPAEDKRLPERFEEKKIHSEVWGGG
ncbi:MAG: nitroreductase family protein [Bacteroidales bacterium]|nr:nitroreductase family protein [Bacteroidales bacterium]